VFGRLGGKRDGAKYIPEGQDHVTAATIQDLAADLMIFVVSSMGYSAVATLPDVVPISRPVLEERVCGKPCPVFALFDPEQGILIDEGLDLLHDPAAQSVLLHELVHYLQWKATGRKSTKCDEWLAREREAYRIQFTWLSSLDVDWHGSSLPRPVLSLIRCQPERVQVSGNSGPHSDRMAPLDGHDRHSEPTIPSRH
jgi:hypothetical protein